MDTGQERVSWGNHKMPWGFMEQLPWNPSLVALPQGGKQSTSRAGGTLGPLEGTG